MPHIEIKPLLTILLTIILCNANWITNGGNSQHTGFVDCIGPESNDDILWEGSLEAHAGYPILIYDNKLIINRKADPEYSPIVCHDLFTGDTLWTRDFEGGDHSFSVPMGFQNNTVYAANWLGDNKGDTLYAINAEDGQIKWFTTIGVLGDYYLGVVFTDNGDIIVPLANSRVARINHLNGDTLWTVKKQTLTISYCGLSVFKETVYCWELGPSNEAMIVAIDVETGKKKYRVEIPRTGSPTPYAVGPFPVIDSNGIIYVHKSNDNLVALKDNGDSLSIIWSDTIRDGGTGIPALGPDGSLYFNNHYRVMRADSKTGKIIDSSITIRVDSNLDINGHFAIDAEGTVYFNPGWHSVLFSFTQDLKLNWVDTIKNNDFGGPALSKHGLLAVAGADNILRVYKPKNLNINKIPYSDSPPRVTFNQKNGFITFTYHIKYNTDVKLLLYDLRGKQIFRKNNLSGETGLHMVKFDYRKENLSSGWYIYRLQTGKTEKPNIMQIVK